MDQLSDYLIKNKILCSKQFGFRSGYSTELSALRLIHRMISHLDAGRFHLNIYIDLSKAFDTLDHTVLLEKLWHYGIRDTELQIIKNYLSNRYQLTEVNGYKSKPLKIKTGVPQGSVLGPLIFLYINNLPNCSIFFEKSCMLMILPCIVILLVVTLHVH